MGKKSFRITLGILTVIIGTLVYMNIQQDNRKDWDVCYEIANRNITWTGAGYSGIYGK